MNSHSFLSLLQFTDGLFPTGGYAHSFGLEYYVQAGRIRDSSGVETFIAAYLRGCAAPLDAVAVVSALAFARSQDLDACLSLDETLDAMKTVTEFREASRQMGYQTLRVAEALTAQPFLQGFLKAVEAGQTPGHHALAFGLVGSVFRWPAEKAALAFLYATVTLLVGAALRLLPMGQIEGQRMIWGLSPHVSSLAREAAGKGPDDLWSFVPGIEVAGMRHAQLEARLFRS